MWINKLMRIVCVNNSFFIVSRLPIIKNGRRPTPPNMAE